MMNTKHFFNQRFEKWTGLWLSVFCLSFFSTSIIAQANLSVTVTGGSSTTSCTDFLGLPPDPLIQVRINDTFWETYGYTNCSPDFPNVQFDTTFNCPSQAFSQIQVCLRVIENDPINPFNCEIIPDDCVEEICDNFMLPIPGASLDYTLAIPAGGTGGGEVNFTINTTDDFTGGVNDFICTAIDFGMLPSGGMVGDASADAFNNYCGSNTGDPTSLSFEGVNVFNNRGVWYQFTTSDKPGSEILIRATSSLTDIIGLQLAMFGSDGDCQGNLTLMGLAGDNADLDEFISLECPDLMPNTTYYVLVDSFSDIDEEKEGRFSLEIIDGGSLEAGDLRCEAVDLGQIPDNSMLEPITSYSNICATATGDPNASSFLVEQGVFFTFQAPASGNISIQAISDAAGIDPIALEMTLFASHNNACNGLFSEVFSTTTTQTDGLTLTAPCLEANQSYWLMVDGETSNVDGIFDLRIEDMGELLIETAIDTTICAGQSVVVGNDTYSSSGEYTNVFTLPSGCDSTVYTTLQVLAPLTTTTMNEFPAFGEGEPNGEASVSAEGGDGNYTYLWSDGQTTAHATDLIGGEEYCVTVTDATGCMAIDCIIIEFITDIIPTVQNDVVDCNGDTDGQLVISAMRGEPPYTYEWANVDNPALNGAGVIASPGELAIIDNLPAGEYSIFFTDEDPLNQDTTVVGIVSEPLPILITPVAMVNASCFSECDGNLEVQISGGNGDYQLDWSNGQTANFIDNLCAGTYSLTVTDSNGCTETTDMVIDEPQEFIATATEVQAVSCFAGTDGQALVTTNGNPMEYIWSTGDTTSSVEGLAAGMYFVTVTNEDRCTDETQITITEPEAPVQVAIALQNAITCNGGSDGELTTTVSGSGDVFSFVWNDGRTTPDLIGVGAGQYEVTVSNENGCEATATFTLTEPDLIAMSLSARDITCEDNFNDGAITIDVVSGGIPPYEFSVDGSFYSSSMEIANLEEGSYDVRVRDGIGCEMIFSATVLGPPEITVDLGDDFILQLGKPFNLEAITNAGDPVFTWKTPDSLNCIDFNCESISVSPLETTTYTVTVFDEATLCSATDEITINVRKDRKVYIPNAFSPREAGPNEKFLVFGGPDVERVETFKIFDRNGALMFERNNIDPNNPGEGWDGTFRGQALRPGVFVWFAEVTFIDGYREIYKGDVTLFD